MTHHWLRYPNALHAYSFTWYIDMQLGHQATYLLTASGYIRRNETTKLPRSLVGAGLRASSEEVGPELSREMTCFVEVLRSAAPSSPAHFGYVSFGDDAFHAVIHSPSFFDEIVYRSRHSDEMPGMFTFAVESCLSDPGQPPRWAITALSACIVHAIRR